MYLFRVKSTNCIAEESAWDDVVFIVAAVDFETFNNSEDQCMVCHVLPGETPTDGVHANAGDGGLNTELPGPQTGSSLTGFSTVQSASQTNPHPVTYTQLTIEKGIDTGVELWETGSPLRRTTVTIPASLPAASGTPGLVSPFVPVQWIATATTSTGVATGNINAKFTLNIPGLPGSSSRTIAATSDQPRPANVPFLNQAGSAFGRRMGIAGMQSLDLSTGKPMLAADNHRRPHRSGKSHEPAHESQPRVLRHNTGIAASIRHKD